MARAGGVMQIAFPLATSATLDPATVGSTGDYDIILASALYDHLVDTDNHWNITPALAVSWDVDTSLTHWTLHLRQGVKFHDGTPFTAEHAAFAVSRILNKSLGSPLWRSFSSFLAPDGVVAKDAHTLVFNLQKPNSFFLQALAERQLGIPKMETTLSGIGTGPFQLVRFNPQVWEVKANPQYWKKGLPLLSGLRGVIIDDPVTRVQSVISGASHLADNVSADQVASVQKSSNGKVWSHQNFHYFLVIFDPTVPPFDDNRVRMALKLAVNRPTLLKIGEHGVGTLANDIPVPLGDPYYPARFPLRKQNFSTVKQLLAAAGHSGGINLTLQTSEAEGGMVDYGVTWSQIVSASGAINVTVSQAPADSYWDQVWLKQPFYVSAALSRFPSERLDVTYVAAAPWNETKMHNPTLDALVDKARATNDPSKQKAALRAAYAIIAGQAGQSQATFDPKLWASKKTVQGLKLEPTHILDPSTAHLA